MKEFKIARVTGRNPDDPTDRTCRGIRMVQMLEPRMDDLCGTITTVAKDNYVIEIVAIALRTRSYAGIPQTIEGGVHDYANALTSVAKDSMILIKRSKAK